VTKLSPEAERVIRQLDEMDDADLEIEDLAREPYRRRILAWWAASREALAFKAHRHYGVLEHFRPGKRKRGEHWQAGSLDFALEDRRRLKGMPGRDTVESIELIAAERHRRHMPHDEDERRRRWGQWCTVDKLGELEEWAERAQDELHDLAGRIFGRLRQGTTGGERHKRAKLRAK
jgi:hypothetical protein